METSIVGVKNFARQTEERRASAFAKEVKCYLETYSDIQYVGVLLIDLNSYLRGKHIPVASLSKLEKDCYFPVSMSAMNILDNMMEGAGLGQDTGEPDRSYIPVPGTSTPSATDLQSIAQVRLIVVDEDGAPFGVEPWDVLNRLWQWSRQRELLPAVAVELGFYLLNRKCDTEGYLQPPCAPGTNDHNIQSQIYSVDDPSHFIDALYDIDRLAKLRLAPVGGAVAEASPGQFEINSHYIDNVLDACNNTLTLKRLVRLMVERHKMYATFMTKPYEEHAGSGTHIHISMLNNKEESVPVDDDGKDFMLLKHALAGIVDLMPASMALLAPSVNPYRRFQLGTYAPTQASWGHNGHTVVLRIPCDERRNHRVEYRVAGTDANPYLVMAMTLAGILHGLSNPRLPSQEEMKGNDLEQEGLSSLVHQSDTLQEFTQNGHLCECLGERSCHVFHTCKHDELLQFGRLITGAKIEWMLKSV